MATLHLVRHGQASFGAANYDQLSPLGHQQCQALGAHYARRGQRFAAVLTGTLQRHRQSWAALAEGLGSAALPAGPVHALPGLNEYDSAALLATVHPGPLAPADTPEAYRHHFRLLRQALAQWMSGQSQPAGMPSYAQFVAGVMAALDQARTLAPEGDVLLVSSGGPISTALAQVLGTPAEAAIDLNMRLRNSAVCELAASPRRYALLTFNHLPHLVDPALGSWITHT